MKTKVAKLSPNRAVAAPAHDVVPLKERRLNFGSKWDYAPAPEDFKYIQVAPRHELFINGQFVAPHSGQYFPSINPAPGKCSSACIWRGFAAPICRSFRVTMRFTASWAMSSWGRWPPWAATCTT